MNGPQHYRNAEAALTQSYGAEPKDAAYLVATAQVHATLALVAATVDASENLHGTGKAWGEVT